MKKSSFVLACTTLLAVQFASARDFADIYTDCGIGAMISPKNDAVAAVTNVTWDLGTTAVSSNISSPDTCVGGQGGTASFIYQSYESLARDLSKGEGKYLDALVEMAGFAVEDKADVVAFLRSDFADAVASKKYAEMNRFQRAEQLYNIVYAES